MPGGLNRLTELVVGVSVEVEVIERSAASPLARAPSSHHQRAKNLRAVAVHLSWQEADPLCR